MKCLSSLIASCATVLLSSCTEPSLHPSPTPVRLGMDKADLLATYGPPLRTEKQSDGNEDWFYHFGTHEQASQSGTESTSTGTERSYAVEHSTTTTTTMRPEPIHLSPDGKVTGEIPTGQVIKQ